MGIAPYSLVIWFMTDVLSHKGAESCPRAKDKVKNAIDTTATKAKEATDKASDR